MNKGEIDFLASMMRREMDSRYKFQLGYALEEERFWLLMNRCCHPGRRIKILPRPIYMATGKPSVRLRTPFTAPVARAIIEATQ